MKTRSTKQWAAAGGALGLVLAGTLGMASAAVAADDDHGIDVSVDIESLTPPGSLSMTIAANTGVVLTEDGSTDDVRQFTGTIPTVTVTDTRTADEIPAGAYWAVTGQASDFVGTDDPTNVIGAEYLGWTPKLLSDTEGNISEGEAVSSVEDDGTSAPATGIATGSDLLVSSFDSAAEIGSFDVNADLALRTPADVAADEYRSTLTLSLFEQS